MIYAIGDIHGQKDALDRALRLIEADGGEDARIVFLGDYVDRGPDARGVLQTLIDGMAEGRLWTAILGNHDRMFARFVGAATAHDDNISSGNSWLHPALGGTATLASYGVAADGALSLDAVQAEARRRVPAEHLAFVDTRPLWHETDELIFVHAGIRPGVPLPRQAEDDLIWIRDGFLEDLTDHGKLVVHGHTALPHPAAYPNRVNLDGGAGYGRPLIPAVFEGRDAWVLTDEGRAPLPPA